MVPKSNPWYTIESGDVAHWKTPRLSPLSQTAASEGKSMYATMYAMNEMHDYTPVSTPISAPNVGHVS